ncbi:hypothetical protein [Roseinatronobacter sp.]
MNDASEWEHCRVTGLECSCDVTCRLDGKPTNLEASRRIASLSPEARAAFSAVVAITGNNTSQLIGAMVEAACVVALSAGCEPDYFARGVKTIWDDRAREFSSTSGVPHDT